MRLSLLLEREPFGRILEETLGTFWSERLGHPVTVRWNESAPGWQPWHGNAHLNFFCVAGTNPACFDVIRKEFSRNRRLLLRPVQRSYVALALHPALLRAFSRLRFSVSMPVPNADQQILIPGNHRLRLLHPKRNEVVVIHKAGFPIEPFQRELAARQGPAAVVAPTLLAAPAHGRWFLESYFSGAPSNRLPAALQASVRQQAATMLSERVHATTARTRSLTDYGGELVEHIRSIAPHLVDAVARILRPCSSADQVVLVHSHGDFHDANILYSASQGIRIIDWEFSGVRSALYDFATLGSGIRLAGDWLACWVASARSWLKDASPLGRLCPVPAAEALPGRMRIWLVEELLLRLEQPLMRLPSEAPSEDHAGLASALCGASEAVR